MTQNSWTPLGSANLAAAELVFVVPHAGAGLISLRSFSRALPSSVQTFGLRLPGRDNSLGSDARWNFALTALLAAADAQRVLREYKEVTKVFFVGQCSGAWLAQAIVASWSPSLHAMTTLVVISQTTRARAGTIELLSQLPSDALWQWLIASGNIPADIAMNQEMRLLLEPIFRSDFEAVERAPMTDDAVPVPLLAIRGIHDLLLSKDDMECWRDSSDTKSTSVAILAGHLPLQESPEEVARVIFQFMDRVAGSTQLL